MSRTNKMRLDSIFDVTTKHLETWPKCRQGVHRRVLCIALERCRVRNVYRIVTENIHCENVHISILVRMHKNGCSLYTDMLTQ